MSTWKKLVLAAIAGLAFGLAAWLLWQIDGLSTREKLMLLGFEIVAVGTGLVFWAMSARIAHTLVSLVDVLTAAVCLAVRLILVRLRVNRLLLRSILAPLFGLPRQFRRP